MDITLLKSELVRDEGFVPHAYQDHLGYWTIGIGRLIDKRRRGGISREEAEYLLENDIGKVIIELRRALPWYQNLSDARQRALVNMAFNLGVQGLLKFKKTLKLMRDGHFERASIEALNSKWAAQVGDRAIRISTLIKNG